MERTAVFLDRDGTIIEDAGYIGDPARVRLIDGAAEAIRRFAAAGHLVVVVSNQSGVARGMFDEEAVARVHERMAELLGDRGATLDGAYYCPFLDGPAAVDERYRVDSELRKPQPGMLQRAARELTIDLARSWMVGDSARDVEAGQRAGCRTILIQRNGAAEPSDVAATLRVDSIMEAADAIERVSKTDVDAPSTPAAARHLPPSSADPRRGAAAGAAQAADDSVRLLREIRDLLDRDHREGRQQDFSILRLGGALLQMLAVVSALWGVIALFDEAAAPATARLALACFLQLASVAAFAIDRFR